MESLYWDKRCLTVLAESGYDRCDYSAEKDVEKEASPSQWTTNVRIPDKI